MKPNHLKTAEPEGMSEMLDGAEIFSAPGIPASQIFAAESAAAAGPVSASNPAQTRECTVAMPEPYPDLVDGHSVEMPPIGQVYQQPNPTPSVAAPQYQSAPQQGSPQPQKAAYQPSAPQISLEEDNDHQGLKMFLLFLVVFVLFAAATFVYLRFIR